MKGRIYKRAFPLIVLALAVAAVAVPGGSAKSSQRTTIPAATSHIQEPGSVSDFDTYNFQEPTGVYDVGLRQPTTAAAGSGGFKWSAAAAGGAFVFGLCLLGTGARLVVRRRGLSAQLHSHM